MISNHILARDKNSSRDVRRRRFAHIETTSASSGKSWEGRKQAGRGWVEGESHMACTETETTICARPWDLHQQIAPIILINENRTTFKHQCERHLQLQATNIKSETASAAS